MIGGDVTLGCLLGQYDKAQSFDVASKAWVAGASGVGSWYLQNGSAAFSTSVHSSDRGVIVQAGSQGGTFAAIKYSYNGADDAFARWFPDISTHIIQTDAWATPGLAGDFGKFYIWNPDASGAGTAIWAGGIMMEHVRCKATACTSAAFPSVRLDRTGATNSASALYLDDVLTQIDPITLHPSYDAEHRQQLIAGQQRTMGGRLYSTVWDKFFAYTLPLQFLPTSHANLINWWWENNFNLVLTLDTSDSTSLRICRIVNTQQPIGRRVSPYFDQWQGALLLESIDRGSLVF